MIQIHKKCRNCQMDLTFTKKDIIPFTKAEKRKIKRENNMIDYLLNFKVTRGFWFWKREEYKFNSRFMKDLMLDMKILSIGKIKCPNCNEVQII